MERSEVKEEGIKNHTKTNEKYGTLNLQAKLKDFTVF